MIISKNLLADFFPKINNYSTKEISDALFKSGIEVEKYEEIIQPTGLYYGIIKNFSKIKGSDKLNLCQVEIPIKKQTFNIVCGASNVRKGLNVVVALPKAVISNGKVIIEKREIFNVESEGMLCAYSELYKSSLLDKSKDSNDGIIELDEDWNVDKEFDVSDLNLNDCIFDLSIPSNRTDLYCAWGIAQELSKNIGVSNSVRDLGVIYRSSDGNWALKKLLLTNNFECKDFKWNMNAYLYIAFNQILFEEFSKGWVVKKKSGYFYKLFVDYLIKLGVNDLDRLEFKPDSFSPEAIALNWENIGNFLCLTSQKQKKLVDKLSYFCFGFTPGNSVVFPPVWRTDIKTSRDFEEELLRTININEILSIPPFTEIQEIDNSFVLAIEEIKELFRNRNYFECSTFNLHKLADGEVKVMNPISNNHVSYRTSGIGELLNVIEENYKRKNDLVPIFEVVEINNKGWLLNLIIPEMCKSFCMNSTKIENDLYDLQALIKRALSYLNKKIVFEESKNKYELFKDLNLLECFDEEKRIIGKIGYLNSNLPFKVWGGEIKLSLGDYSNIQCPKVSDFPPSFKDISIELENKDIRIGRIISNLSTINLKKVEIIERYETEEMISYLLRCKFKSDVKTLTRVEIDKEVDLVCKQLKDLNCKIR